MSSRLARIVEMRYFGGMTEMEIGEAMGLNQEELCDFLVRSQGAFVLSLDDLASQEPEPRILLQCMADPTAKDAVDDGAQARAEREAVLVALGRIARRQRACLVLRYYLDLPESEVAGVLGISQGSVKTHTSPGLAAMANLLGDRR